MFTTVVGTIKCTIGPLHTLHLCIGLHVYYLIIIVIEALVWDYGPRGGHLFGGGEVLQIQMEKWIFFFLILDTVTFAEPTNQMPCYSTCMSWWGMGILTLTCVWLAVPSTRQCNSTSSKAIIIYYYYIGITGRSVLCLDSLPLISLR